MKKEKEESSRADTPARSLSPPSPTCHTFSYSPLSSHVLIPIF